LVLAFVQSIGITATFHTLSQAKLVATPNTNGGADIVVTFEEYVETHENIKGEFSFDSAFNISKYMLRKIEPEIMKLENSYDLIRIVNKRLKKYHYARIEMFLHLYNDSQKKGA